MIKLIIILSLIIILETALCIHLFICLNKSKRDKKRFELMYNNMKTAANKIEENISNTNAKKKKLNTGNTLNDINNAADIMHQQSKGRRTTS